METYDVGAKKAVIVLASSLPRGTAANVTAHLSLALGHILPLDEMGRLELIDSSNIVHRGICKYPIIVTTVKATRLRQFVAEARACSELLLVDYPQEMHTTRHDDDLTAALAVTPEEAMTYYGAIAFGATAVLDKISGKFMLWGADDKP